MKSDYFRNHVLGFWSSHPVAARRRCWILAIGAFVPLACVVLIGFFMLIGGGGGSGSFWLTAFGMATTFGIGAAGSITLCAHLAKWQRPDTSRRWLFDPVVLTIALVLGTLGPFALTQLSELGVGARLLLLVFSCFPLLGLLVAIQISPFERAAEWVRQFPLKPRQHPTSVRSDHPPKWLNELLTMVDQGADEVTRIELSDDEISPDSPRRDLRHIFGVDVPTQDQVELLERFVEFPRHALEDPKSNSDTSSDACPDLLVTGNPGSGKTTALLACAVYAALVRGQRVLWIVPDSLRLEAARERVENQLAKLRLTHYVLVSTISATSVDRWLRGVEPIPHVLLGTADTIERDFYGHESTREMLDRLRRLVLLPEVILVDDFLDFEDAERSHLPFILDKHRLLLAAEQLPMQAVVTCRKLAGLGEEVLALRLFTVKQLDKNRNVLSMKPRSGAQAWRVRLAVDEIPETVDRMVAWCLERGLDVALYHSGLDETERLNQQKRLSKRGKGHFVVLGDLDRPLDSPDSVDVDTIFYQEAIHEDVCMALRLHTGNDDTVIFCITPRGVIRRDTSGIIPVVADRSASPLLAVHLRGIARFLMPWSPIPLDDWIRFGIEHTLTSAWHESVRVTDARFAIDAWHEPGYPVDLWSYGTLEQPTTAREPVSVFGLPDPTWSIYRTPKGYGFATGQLAQSSLATPLARRARWYDREAQFGREGEVDLAHAYRYKLVYGRRGIGLRTIEQDTAGGPIRLQTEVWHGGGADRYLPVCRYEWTLPHDQIADRFWGSSGDRLRWFALESPTVKDVSINVRIVGHMSEYAAVTDIPPVTFDYPANMRALILSPESVAQEDLSSTLGDRLQGPWSTDEDERFWPALTAAINDALRTKMPGLHYFARVFAFSTEGPSKEAGLAVVWFIEPTSSGRTASRVMTELLRYPDQRDAFFGSIERYLQQLERTDRSPQQYMRSSIRMGIQGDHTPPRTEGAIALLRILRG